MRVRDCRRGDGEGEGREMRGWYGTGQKRRGDGPLSAAPRGLVVASPVMTSQEPRC